MKVTNTTNHSAAVAGAQLAVERSDAAERSETARGVFAFLAPLDRWVPFALIPSARRPGKVDKIPSNGTVGLSTARPDDWMGLDEALGLSMVHPDLNGVGLVMTKGIEQGDRLLIGFDFDGLDPAKLQAALDEIEAIAGYVEYSPSGNGLRAFAWVKKAWAEPYKDSMKARPGFCDHVEIYFGTSPRFLTVTFNAQRIAPIKTIDEKAWRKIESWGLSLKEKEHAAAPVLDTGTPLELDAYKITDKQRKLLSSQPNIDRSAILHGLIIALVDQGAPAEDILATLISNQYLWAYCLEHRHDDPERALVFAREEVQRGYGNSKFARSQRLAGFNESWRQPISVTKPKEKPEPLATWPAPFPGAMEEAVNAALKVAPKPQPALTTLAALVGMAAACGGFYRLPNGGRLNLFACGLAPTGYGKDVPRQSAVLIAQQASALVRGRPASGQGAEDALVPHRGVLFEIDEVAHLFAAMNDRRAPGYLVELAAVMLRLYSASSGTYHTRIRAGTTAPPRSIANPAVSVIGFATPEKFGQAVTVDNIAEGLVGRMLFATTNDNPRPRRVRDALTLPAVVKTAALAVAMARRMHLVQGDTLIGVTADAGRALDDLLQEFDQRGRNSSSPFAGALHVRSYEKAERIAGVLAVWTCPERPIINLDHVQWAAQAVRASDAAVLSFVDEHMHGGLVQSDAAKLRALLRRTLAGEFTTDRHREAAAIAAGWAPRRFLLKLSKLDKAHFDAALAYLFDLADIEGDTVENAHANGRTDSMQVLRLTDGATGPLVPTGPELVPDQ